MELMRRGAPYLLLALATSQCRSATDVRVSVTSEVDCSTGARVALVVASTPQDFARAAPASESAQCNASGTPGEFDYGSVVIAPASNDDEAIAFELMTHVDGLPPENCLDPQQRPRCIVSSREVHFAAHEEIAVPIDLRKACLGVVCPLGQTCESTTGQCVRDILPTNCSNCGESLLPASTAPNCGNMGGLQPGSPWPMPGFCPTRAGRSSRNGPRTNQVKWTFAMGAIASMSPAIAADGTIYVGSNDHTAYAIDPTGKLVWKAPVGNNINRTGFLVGQDGTVYVGCADRKVYAFTPTGMPKWTAPVNADVSFTLAAGGDGSIYVNGLPPSALFALAPATGTPRWQLARIYGASGVAVGLDGTLYVSGNDATLHALKPADGSEAWSAPLTGNGSTPTVGDDGTIYVVDTKTLHAFAPGGAPKWTAPVDGASDGVSLGPDGTVYVATLSGTLYAFTSAGKQRWTYARPGQGWWQPPAIGADGTVYMGGTEHALYAVSPSGTLLWTVPTGAEVDSQPAIGADGTLYFVSSDFKLYAVGP
ncbi:MAG TPA: PQQ-binding-like beta-propeller repeat protein [Polyangiaceae bacterium]